MMKFSHQMVKSFYEILNVSNISNFLQHLANDNTKINISVRKIKNPSQPNLTIMIITTTSFWLSLPS